MRSFTDGTGDGGDHRCPLGSLVLVSLDAAGAALLSESLSSVYCGGGSGADADRGGLDPRVGLLLLRF